MTKQTDILVIGAGLTGLTLAYYLKKANQNFMVVEREDRVGGAIQTLEKAGFIYEKGPNTGVLGNEEVMELFDEIGRVCKLKVAGNQVKKRYVLKNRKWEALPSGFFSGITTPLFTFSDKLRLLGEPFRKPGTNPNETLAQLVTRRMGKSFLNYAVDPFILGIYAGDPSYLLPRHALSKLYNLEQKYGSFIGGSMKLAREKKKLGIKTRATRQIFSVEGGLRNLVEGLYKLSDEENFTLGVNNLNIKPVAGGYEANCIINGEPFTIQAKQVITTIGAHELGKLLPLLSEDLLAPIINLQYAKVVQVSLGFKEWKGRTLDAFGGLIPHSEKRDILGILFPSAFFPERAPKGGALLSVFMGGVRRPDIFKMSDDEIRQIVKKEVKSLMQLPEFNPDLLEISRYPYAIPQYGPDCDARFAAIEEAQAKYPGLVIAGNLRNGIGMADRIKQGTDLSKMCEPG